MPNWPHSVLDKLDLRWMTHKCNRRTEIAHANHLPTIFCLSILDSELSSASQIEVASSSSSSSTTKMDRILPIINIKIVNCLNIVTASGGDKVMPDVPHIVR